MEVDDLAPVFHLGEKLFTASKVPNLYRTWDEFEVVGLFQSDKEEELLSYLHGFLKKYQLPVKRQMLEEGRYNLIVAPAGGPYRDRPDRSCGYGQRL